jgi:hypothetical protein
MKTTLIIAMLLLTASLASASSLVKRIDYQMDRVAETYFRAGFVSGQICTQNAVIKVQGGKIQDVETLQAEITKCENKFRKDYNIKTKEK